MNPTTTKQLHDLADALDGEAAEAAAAIERREWAHPPGVETDMQHYIDVAYRRGAADAARNAAGRIRAALNGSVR